MQHFIQPFSVGEALLKQNALLLPDVYDSFHEKLQQIMQLRGIACDGSDIRSIETPNWLRSQLSSLLECHLAYQCCVEKYGIYSPVSPWWRP